MFTEPRLNTQRVKMRLCKHGKSVLLLKFRPVQASVFLGST